MNKQYKKELYEIIMKKVSRKLNSLLNERVLGYVSSDGNSMIGGRYGTYSVTGDSKVDMENVLNSFTDFTEDEVDNILNDLDNIINDEDLFDGIFFHIEFRGDGQYDESTNYDSIEDYEPTNDDELYDAIRQLSLEKEDIQRILNRTKLEIDDISMNDIKWEVCAEDDY